ncbi:MAG: type II toxin-antitoxin system VapC family toxin [Nanoarchaeota archaeon]
MAYVDTNVFVYASSAIKESAVKSQQSQLILEKVARQHLSATTSVITWDEVAWASKKVLPLHEALDKAKEVLAFPNLAITDFTLIIANKASELAEKYRLKPHDSIHAATAILNGEKAIITDDADFDKVRELKRVTLAEASR